MSEKYYVLMLTDPATPGFCSFNKMYVGTEETINTVANNLEKAGHYPKTVSALRNYFKGNQNEALNWLNKALEIYIKVSGEESQQAKITKEWLSGLE